MFTHYLCFVDYGEEIDKALDNLSVIQSSQGLDTSRHRSTSVTEIIQRYM